MENPQVGIQFSSPIQILFTIGFNHLVEGNSTLNVLSTVLWVCIENFVHCTTKQGHMQSIGAGNAPARHRPRARVHALPPRLRRAPPYHARTSKFGRERSARQPLTHLQDASRPVSPRATRRARARRGAVGPPAAHARRGSLYPAP
jgi:hypothetical protein